MPTYEYICRACGHEWEAFQSIKDDPLTKCPQCRARKAKRQVSLGSGFILKGGGWYSDLYSSQPKGGENHESASSAPATTSGPTTKATDKSSGDQSGSDKPSSDKPSSGSGSRKSKRGSNAKHAHTAT